MCVGYFDRSVKNVNSGLAFGDVEYEFGSIDSCIHERCCNTGLFASTSRKEERSSFGMRYLRRSIGHDLIEGQRRESPQAHESAVNELESCLSIVPCADRIADRKGLVGGDGEPLGRGGLFNRDTSLHEVHLCNHLILRLSRGNDLSPRK